MTRRVIYLEDGDVAAVTRAKVTIVDRAGHEVARPVRVSEARADAVELGPYRHYMQKEIHEQPRALSDTLEGVMDEGIHPGLFGKDAEALLKQADSVLILAAGTSHYASLVGRLWLESVARLPCTVELGHEYRYRDSIPNPRQLIVTLSQSGETLDTMEALKRAKELGHAHTLDLQRAGERHPTGVNTGVLYPRRRRDRRGLDQGLHHPARGAVHFDAGIGQVARPAYV